MADNVNVTPGSGATVATDEVTINAVTVQAQRVKAVLGKDSTYTADLAGRDLGGGDGALYSDPRNPFVRVSQTPTVSTTPAYSVGDAIGGLLTFAGAARATGLPTIVEAATLVDKSDIRTPITLVLFNQTFTASVDNAAFNPSAADLANYVGHFNFAATDYGDFSTNSAGAQLNLDLPIIPTGTSVFGQMYVTSTTPTYLTTTALIVSLTFRQQ